MKRTFAKRSFQAVMAMFFLIGGLMLTATSAHAQQTLGTSNNLNWKDTPNALTTLSTVIQGLNAQMPPQGAPNYNEYGVRVLFYKTAYRFINDGEAVATAVPKAANYIGGHGPAGDNSGLGFTITKALINQISTEATDLLTD